MTRRDFIAGLGSAAAWPLAGRAQQGDRVRRVGMLLARTESDQLQQPHVEAFRDGMAKLGWIEGRNLRIDLRFGGGDADSFRSFAADLVGLAPDAIVTASGAATTAVQQQTGTIPIVFIAVGDPVAGGIVKRIARPEGNTTGITNLFDSIAGKWVELLREAVPGVDRFGCIYNAQVVVPGTAGYGYLLAIEEAARALRVQAIRIPYRDATNLVHGIDAFAAEPNGGLIVVPPPPGDANRRTIHRLAAQHQLPNIYAGREFVAEGGLMSYGSNLVDLFRRASFYVDRLLRGARVSELPVEFPTGFKLVVNLKTARALGLTIPEVFLQRADEVIE
jgi:putative ABC transport system substrate-binding protein